MKKLIDGKDSYRVAVHDGVFHADDVLCVAMLRYVYGNEKLEIVRSRDMEKLLTCDYILDVGRKDDVSDNKVWLDHHQKDSLIRENRVRAAACGKLFGLLFEDDIELSRIIFREFIYVVEADDNGQNVEELGLKPSKLAFVKDFVPSYLETKGKSPDESKFLMDAAFEEAVEITEKIFEREIRNAEARIEAAQFVDTCAKELSRKVLVLPEYVPWKDRVVELNEKRSDEEKIVLVCFPSLSGGYNVQVVPKSVTSFESHILLPLTWMADPNTGKPQEELPGYIFCHPGRFIAGFDCRENAVNAAELCLLEIK